MKANNTPSISELEVMLEDLSPEIQYSQISRLKNAPWAQPKPDEAGKLKLRFVYSALLLAMLVITATMFTPAGQAFARRLMEFFIPGDTNTQPLPGDQVEAVPPALTPEPIRAVVLLPANQVISPTLEPTSQPVDMPGIVQAITLEQAAELAGFDPIQPAALPRDYVLQQVNYWEDANAVSLYYAPPQGGDEFINIVESLKIQTPMEVGASAKLEKHDLNGVSAEMVSGLWLTKPGASEKTWVDLDYVNRMRWKQDEVYIEMYFMLNQPESPARLSKEEQIQTAKSMVDRSLLSLPAPTLTLADTAFTSVAEIQQFVDFPILQPALLPENMPFSHARLLGDTLVLFYGAFSQDKIRTTGDVLTVSEYMAEGSLEESLKDLIDDYPAEAMSVATVNGLDAVVFKGSINTEAAEAGKPTPPSAWADEGELGLFYKQDNQMFAIHFRPGANSGLRLTVSDLQKIAESMK